MDNLGRIKILIVEDDLLIAENLKEVLQDLGYAVAEPCGNKEEALNRLEGEEFDLAILDINLHGEDEGIEIGKHIRSNYGIPLLFLTAFADNKTIAAAAHAKPSAYLVKPVSPSNLFASIQIAIHNHENNKHIIAETSELRTEKEFFVKIGNKISRVSWEDVICINAGKNYVTIKIGKHNFPDYPIRDSLSQVVNNLIPKELKDSFVQINRSQYFNISFFNGINKEVIVTPFGNFEIGEKYKKELKEKLNIVGL